MKVLELLVGPIPVIIWLLFVILSHLFAVQRVVLALDFSRTRHWGLSVELAAATLHLLCLDYISHVGRSALIMRSGEGCD